LSRLRGSTAIERAFERYIGIDYSGAETSESGLRGLRIYVADATSKPVEVMPPAGPRKYWNRRGIAEWLVKVLREGSATLVGIDHGFSFPLQYFQEHGLPLDWDLFLDDFQLHWPTDEPDTYVDFVRDGICGNGAARTGDSRWRRLTEQRTRRAKSVFHFDCQGSVAKSTHSGLPWLRYVRQNTSERTQFWPFDGWEFPEGQSVLAEVYPSLWSKSFAAEDRDCHQHDAYSIAAWMRQVDGDGSLRRFANPDLKEEELGAAKIEGWILGVW
jgi:hypothetical protein